MIKSYEKNFFGAKLNSCSTNQTGFKRNGCCESVEGDYGKHIICAEVSREFLNFSLSKGNDLITPNNEFKFPVLKLVIDGVYAQVDGMRHIKSHAPRKSFLHRQV